MSQGITSLHDVRSKVEVHGTSDTAFCKIVNSIGDICERTYCDKVNFYIVNKILRFNLRYYL